MSQVPAELQSYSKYLNVGRNVGKSCPAVERVLKVAFCNLSEDQFSESGGSPQARAFVNQIKATVSEIDDSEFEEAKQWTLAKFEDLSANYQSGNLNMQMPAFFYSLGVILSLFDDDPEIAKKAKICQVVGVKIKKMLDEHVKENPQTVNQPPPVTPGPSSSPVYSSPQEYQKPEESPHPMPPPYMPQQPYTPPKPEVKASFDREAGLAVLRSHGLELPSRVPPLTDINRRTIARYMSYAVSRMMCGDTTQPLQNLESALQVWKTGKV